MKNKEFTKVYEGLQSLIRVAMGDSVSNDTYFEFKKYFRYPGELLERMEQYGYGSADDYLSAIAALRWAKNRKLDISEMCVGTQLEDFLKKAEEKGKEENDLLLLYSVICYENDATEITGDDLATLLDAAKENTQESVVYFLKKILDDRIHHWNLQGYVDKFLLASKILVLKMDSISSLAQEDVCECADFFMDLMEVSYALKHISEQFSLSIKENMGAASDIILVFSDLYKEPVKKSYEKKLLEAGFSNMDILNLNMGIWYVYERTTELYVSSEIKWWRLAKRWFQSLFLQDKEVPFDGNRLMNLFDKKMPIKIDGEDLAPKFLLAGFAHGIPCVNNSYLLFYILTMYGSYRHSSERVNQLSLWESICTNHPLHPQMDRRLFDLKERLLSFAGEAVCLPAYEPDLENILSYGQFWLGYNAERMLGEDCHCHSNSALLWEVNKDKTVICTGYALSADGMWRQHSWLIHRNPRSNRVVEITRPRVLYYGFAMTPELCERFVSYNVC